MHASGEERKPYDPGDPANREMFSGIRHGRPGDQKFSLRAFLVMVAIAAVVTLVLDFFFPRRPPPAPRPRPAAAHRVPPHVRGTVNVRLAPPTPPPKAPPAAPDGGS